MSTQTEIKITHAGIDIVYNEETSKFCFNLRGRDREAMSLKQAREIIDTPAKEKTEFKRMPCWYPYYQGGFIEAEITSIASGPRWSQREEVWISYKNPAFGKSERSKVYSSECFARSEANDGLVAQYRELDKQIEALQKQRTRIKEKELKPVKLPKVE